jgi:cytochrome c-type biogenesis protein CcmE
MKTRASRNRWIMAGALIAAAAGFAVIAGARIGDNLVYYWSPSQLRGAGDKAYGVTIRLGGMVVKNSVTPVSGSSGLEFNVTDGKATVHVRSRGVPPQMFREGIGVVVEGTMNRGGWFESNRLMVSHNNEYRAPKHDAVDTEKLIRSTKGLDD